MGGWVIYVESTFDNIGEGGEGTEHGACVDVVEAVCFEAPVVLAGVVDEELDAGGALVSIVFHTCFSKMTLGVIDWLVKLGMLCWIWDGETYLGGTSPGWIGERSVP